jgi:hypothetical protein
MVIVQNVELNYWLEQSFVLDVVMMLSSKICNQFLHLSQRLNLLSNNLFNHNNPHSNNNQLSNLHHLLSKLNSTVPHRFGIRILIVLEKKS